jgi:hypothetical protein
MGLKLRDGEAYPIAAHIDEAVEGFANARAIPGEFGAEVVEGYYFAHLVVYVVL